MKSNIILEYINKKRGLYEEHKLSELQIEIMIRAYKLANDGIKPTIGDIFSQSTYRYVAHMYKSADELVEKGFMSLTERLIKVKKRRYYHVTSNGFKQIQHFL
jgi:hypothetical protein